MKTLTLKERAKKLKLELTAVYYAYRDPGINLLPKLIIIITLGYALSPIDLIPDFIPILGYLDDLILLPALITLSIKLIPEHIMEEVRKKAEENPLTLKKNWKAAAVIILFWVFLIAFIVVKIFEY